MLVYKVRARLASCAHVANLNLQLQNSHLDPQEEAKRLGLDRVGVAVALANALGHLCHQLMGALRC